MDETFIKLKGVWKCLYRAADKEGNTVDFLLMARRFFDKAIQYNAVPDKVTTNKSAANRAALEQLNQERDIPFFTIRQVKYLNNIVEHDHCAVSLLTDTGMTWNQRLPRHTQ